MKTRQTTPEFKRWLESACRGERLGRSGARAAMDHLISGRAVEAQTSAFLGALEARGISAEELAGFARSLRAHAVTVPVRRRPLIDTCGTGGDGLQTFNLSTAAAFVAAGAGAAVAKHGNRSVSSRCGSADVLEALGVAADAAPAQVRRSVEEDGFGFFFAPRFHPALRHVGPVRRALGVRTVFNLLGPLVNPALVRRQVVGIYDGGLLETYARVLAELGAERVMVVHGADGMDELTLTGPTQVCHMARRGGAPVFWNEEVAPEDVGLKRAKASALRGGDAAANARLMVSVLGGEPGPLLDATLYNAAAAVLVAGLARTLREGLRLAQESVASGKARGVLEALRRRKRR